MPPSRFDASVPPPDPHIDAFARLVQEVLDQSKDLASEQKAQGRQLDKISMTQDAIADRLDRGQVKLDDHEVRLGTLERAKIVYDTERQTVRRMSGIMGAVVLHLGRAAWGLVYAGGAYLLAHYFKPFP